MSKPVRVLDVVSTLFTDGGIENILLGILRKYDRSRFHHDVCCITREDGTAAGEARALGSELLFCRKSVNLAGFSGRFRDLIANRRYDVVHSHVNSWSGVLMRGAAEAGVPVRVAHLHSASSSLAGRNVGWNPAARLAAAYVDRVGLRWIGRYATHVLGVSEAALDLHWPAWRSEPGRFHLWAGGVDTDRFKPRVDAAPSRVPSLIAVGSFTPDKNQSELIDVLARTRERSASAALTLVGTGPREDDVKTRARAAGLGEAVSFRGVRTDVPDLLAAADVFLSASKREGLPQAVLEAQACGLPVVASDIGPHREAVAPELKEYLYPPGRPEAAAERVSRLLGSSELRAAAGAAARRFVVERFGQKARLEQLQDWHESWTARAEARA
jgi:glycosyltransferase involved in cell wall biosynthesis